MATCTLTDKEGTYCEKHHCGFGDFCLVPGCPHCGSSKESRLEGRRRERLFKMEERIETLEKRTARDMRELVRLRAQLRKLRKLVNEEALEEFGRKLQETLIEGSRRVS